jgi:hypothetical protein
VSCCSLLPTASGLSPLKSKTHLLRASFSQGEQHSLDIAFCDGESGECFAWNNRNYDATNEMYVYPPHLLMGDKFKVVVALHGDWVSESFSFVFRTENKGFSVES